MVLTGGKPPIFRGSVEPWLEVAISLTRTLQGRNSYRTSSCTALQVLNICQYWLPVDYKFTDPQFDSRWYTFGFIPDVVTNCKAIPG